MPNYGQFMAHDALSGMREHLDPQPPPEPPENFPDHEPAPPWEECFRYWMAGVVEAGGTGHLSLEGINPDYHDLTLWDPGTESYRTVREIYGKAGPQ